MDVNKSNKTEFTVVLPHDQWEAMLKSMDSNRQRMESIMSILDAGDRSRIDFILDDLCTLASMVESELYGTNKYETLQKGYPVFGEELIFSPSVAYELVNAFDKIEELVKRLPENKLLKGYATEFEREVLQLVNGYMTIKEPTVAIAIEGCLSAVISEAMIELIKDKEAIKAEKEKS